jgi:hypothetical protein
VLRRWIAWCAVAAIVVLGTSFGISLNTRHHPSVAIKPSGQVVFISVPALKWDSTTHKEHPQVYAMTRRGAVGGVLVRNYRGHSCSKNSWLTVSAVARTGVFPGPDATEPGEEPGPCPPIPRPLQEGPSAYFPTWADIRRATHNVNPKVDLGLLGSSFDLSDKCIMAAGPAAAIGAANRTGTVRHYVADPRQVDFNACALTLVSLGTPSAELLPSLLKRIPDNATVIVAGIADDRSPEHLRGAVITGPGIPHGRLTSLNTRQPGVVTTADLARLLLLQAPNVGPPKTEARQPLVLPTTDVDGPFDSVKDLGKQLSVEYSVAQTFFLRSLTIAGLILAVGVFAVVVYRRWAHRNSVSVQRSRPLRGLGAWIAGAMSSIPASTFLVGLVPWWDAPHPGLALTAGVLAIAVTISAIGYFGPWRRWRPGPMCVILGITALTVALDVVHGSRLQFTSMLGLQPVYGGRFYGVGNVGFAMMATAALVFAAILAGHARVAGHASGAGHRWLAALTVLIVGVPVIIVDGYPEWGADGGGPAALLPAFAYLAMNAGGLKVTWQRVAVIGSSTAGIVALVAFADYLRPPSYRTHLGEFVAGLLEDGRWGGVGQIVEGNWKLLTSAWYVPLSPLLLVLAIALLVAPPLRWLRPVQRLWESVPFLGHGLAAATICWTLGFFANDSGAGIPPIGLFVLAPLLFALGIRSGGSPADRATEGPDGGVRDVALARRSPLDGLLHRKRRGRVDP